MYKRAKATLIVLRGFVGTMIISVMASLLVSPAESVLLFARRIVVDLMGH